MTKPALLGNVASINASLAMVLGDATVMAGYRGIGDGDLEDSDHQRACDALAGHDFAMLDVGKGSVVVVTLAIGQGIARVFRAGERIVVVETFASDDDDRFLAFVASAPSRTRSVASLVLPSGKLVIAPTTETGDDEDSLSIDAPAEVAISIEPESQGAWGHGRRLIVAPA